MSLPSIVNKNKPLDDSSFIKPPNINDEENNSSKIPYWTEDPNILFDKKYIFEYYPTENMTYNQKLNTITRVIIILSVILFIFTRNIWVLVVSAMTIFSIYLLYKNNNNIAKKRFLEKEGYQNPAQIYMKEHNMNNSIEPKENIFQEPTTNNPFSNILIPDYEYNPNKKPAPPSSNEIVNSVILQKAKDLVKEQNPGQPDISDKLFKDLNEELNFEQSMMPFYSTSNTTIPNDQGGFADFCYGNSISCKEGNLFACARNTSHYTLY